MTDRSRSEPAVVRTRGLTRRFGSTEALIDLDLEVPGGALFALVGPNGAGKTTAIKSLLNIIEPTSGQAEVLGTDSRKLGAREFQQLGYVSENQQLPDWMRVRYFLDYCSRFYPGWSNEDLAALIYQFELPLDRKLRQLSRGMRMKAALAASLAYKPRLIILDEPFGGLDVLVREQLIESLLERAAESTVLMVSQDISEIESFASHIAYLDEGRLRFTEETGSLADRFREIEVTADHTIELPQDWPDSWLNAEASNAVLRVIDSRYDAQRSETELRHLIPGVRGIAERPMALRAIFLALAKSAKKTNSAR